MVRLIPDLQDASKTKLIVGDTGNRRVLVWNTLPTKAIAQPMSSSGVPDVHTAIGNSGAYGGVSRSSIGSPGSVQRWRSSGGRRRRALSDLDLETPFQTRCPPAA